MYLSKELESLYEKIDFYNRYKSMINIYKKEVNLLETVDKEVVIKIFDEIGYSAKYKSKEKFFQILQIENDKEFYFHASFKFGRVELVFGLSEDFKGENVGGQISGICKRIELCKGIVSEGYLKKPTFLNYYELKEILVLSLQLYEDLKKEFLKLDI